MDIIMIKCTVSSKKKKTMCKDMQKWEKQFRRLQIDLSLSTYVESYNRNFAVKDPCLL